MAPRPANVVQPARITESFDADWRFCKGDVPGAEKPDFADANWRQLNVPHDWSIDGPFDKDAPTRGSGAFLPGGIAWYRKTFTLPAEAAGKRVFVEFDGVMQNSDVWINGRHLGRRPYGYVSFRYELTDLLDSPFSSANIIAVRADTSQQPSSRWYTGGGIYRHVRLILTDPLHVDQWATFVSTPAVTPALAIARVETNVLNQSAASREAVVRFSLVSPSGDVVATADSAAQPIPAAGSVPFRHEFSVARPQLWDLDTPRLYRAVVTVRSGGKTTDDETTAFGIRDARFEAATGFWLNGRNLKVLGVCLHHDGGAFGAAVPLAVWEHRLATLRTLGVNAIRTAHNPPDPGFLDLCDRMGFLVMDELFDCWTVGKTRYDYHLYFEEWSKTDVRDTVRRDRNHPSIILYSAGNEIHDTLKEELAKRILAGLVAEFHASDPTRPVTQALFRPNRSHDYTNGLADMLDVIGTNYRDSELLAAWRAKPTRKIIGTEQDHLLQTWLLARDNPPHAGQFLWSGVDYLGEAWRWPMIGSSSGLLDRTAGIKPRARERQSWWSGQPMVALTRRVAPALVSNSDPGYEPMAVLMRRRQELFSDWNPVDSQPHDETVEVYSNCESVELFLDGRSLGAKPLDADAAPRVWTVPYAPGTLRAVARNGGKDAAFDELRTAGAPAAIVVTADRPDVSPDWEDVVRVTAKVVDSQGVLVPTAGNVISFAIDGPGTIVAVDNADNTSHEPFQAAQRQAYQGRCVAFIRATAPRGRITFHASAPDLKAGSVRLSATAPATSAAFASRDAAKRTR